MSVVEIKYNELEQVIKCATKMSSDGWGGLYHSYSEDVKKYLKKSVSESRLVGEEPKGNNYCVLAQGDIDNKVSALSNRATEWSNLASNLEKFETMVKKKDADVKTIIDNTFSSYIDYSGISGFCLRIYDAAKNFLTVDAMNSNFLTRSIGDIGKQISDDINARKKDALDWFKHGEGRYVLGIVKGVATITGAVIGVVLSALAVPFTGGTSSVIAVGCIGILATTIAAGYKMYTSSYAIANNTIALKKYDTDPGTARLHGDTDTLDEQVDRTIYSSPEAYQKAKDGVKIANTLNSVCEVVSMVTGLATSFCTSDITVVVDGAPIKKTGFNFSPKNIKENVLKTFGIKTSENSTTIVTSESSYSSIDGSVSNGTGTSIIYESDDVAAAYKYSDATEKSVGNVKYKTQVKGKTTVVSHSEYTSMSFSNGVGTETYETYKNVSKVTTKSVDYSNALMSSKKVSKIKEVEKLAQASAAEKRVIYAKKALNTVKKATDVAKNGTDASVNQSVENVIGTVKDTITKNTFMGSVDKYVYSMPTKSNATFKDFIKGIGGSNAGKVWNLVGSFTN